MLYARVKCGFRAVVDILKIVNQAFGGILGKIPSRNTIENWVKKCGLDIYNTPKKSIKPKDYAMIVDESMMIGSEKLLLTLGVPAKHKGTPLTHKDVSVLDMSVSSSWDGEGIKEKLLAARDKVGASPQYVISDNASIMLKAVKCAEMKHHHDISHSLGMFLERCYKEEEDFIAYTKSMSSAQSKHNMKKMAYLLPPRQRTIARFINLSNWVNWSQNMLQVYHTLSEEKRTLFAFVPANASFIDELSEVMGCINRIEEECKQNGFSHSTIKKCLEDIGKTLLGGNTRMKKLGEAISGYILKEGEMLENEENLHNNSSDIIESTFGVYKVKKSPNKLYGVTSFILLMPAYTKLGTGKIPKDYPIKEHLENVRLREIHQWSNSNLTPNLVTKRINTFKIA